ncbi:MAG TPA: LysE family transporter [Bacteroidota bacterium]|jgi:threonine/homoserine/homoserine lactone efflux protein
MLIPLVIGLATGFILALPPGPLAVAVMRKGLEGRFRAGLQVALGAVVMDCLYALIATFASSRIVVWITGLVAASAWFLLSFQIVCIVILIVLGVRYVKHRHTTTEPFEEREKAQEVRAEQMGYSSPFLLGIIIALTNLAIPTLIPSLVGVVGFLHSNKLLTPKATSHIFFSLGFGFGTGVWFTILLQIIHRHHQKINHNVMNGIFRFAGGTFLLFAAVMTVMVFTKTEWSALF